MGTGESLSAPQSVQRLQSALHAKAKESPGFRFYSLCDKVWRDDVLAVAWQEVRRNGGAAGADGQTVADIEAYGAERWLGGLARDLKAGTYRPDAVRQVLIPKKQRGKFRPLGIPCIRDRVVQTAALLVLSPIFEADLPPEQYAYRPGRSAHDAVKRVHRLLNSGHQEVVDADLSDYFGQIPHAELLKSVARRVSDGRMLGWVKAWLEMAVEEDDGKGGKRRTNRARRERKGTPQGSPISTLFSNIYMRRFIVGWKVLGYAQRFKAHIVNYADDLVVLGKAPSTEMRGAFESLMQRLKLTVNAEKTRCCRVPDWTQLSPGHGPRLYRHTPEPGKRSAHLPQGERGDRNALRPPGTGGHRRAAEPTNHRLGELLLPGPGQSGVRSGRPTHDPAAASMAVPQAQGEVRETRAILGYDAVGRTQARSPWSANGQLSVGEGMISSESPMREIRTLGSPSGDWKRSHGVD